MNFRNEWNIMLLPGEHLVLILLAFVLWLYQRPLWGYLLLKPWPDEFHLRLEPGSLAEPHGQ